MNDKPKRLWYQYSLRTLLLLFLVVSAILAWKVPEARRQRSVRQQIYRLGATAGFRFDPPFAGLKEWLGDASSSIEIGFDLFGTAWIVTADDDKNCTSEIIPYLPELHDVEELQLIETGITDEHLEMLYKMAKLRDLSIPGSAVTDAGIAKLTTIPNLKVLDLNKTGVTDECIPDLIKIATLERIYVEGTQISKQGRQRIRQAFPKAHVWPEK